MAREPRAGRAEQRERLPVRLRLAFAAAIAAALIALGFAPAWQDLELKGFDALSVLTAPNTSSFPITLVGIDEDSFAQLGRQWPWPRGMHAKLIQSLEQAGAMVIAFDMQFSEPDAHGADQDRAFADAIGHNGTIVLAADRVYRETAYTREWLRVDPLEIFKQAGATTGYARIELGRDGVARTMPGEPDALWREIARRIRQQHPEVQVSEPGPGAMIRYAGPILTYPYVSYYQALDPSKLPADAFKDQVVIIGRHLQASPEVGAEQSDVFRTPFTATTGWFTPGAEIHANILETALRGDAIYPVAPRWDAALVALVVLASAAALATWRPLRGGLIVLVLVALLLAADWFLFKRMNVWLPVGAPILGTVSVYSAFGVLAFLVERRRRAELRRAFALYVSAEVVDHVMANPQRLGLGGERRDVTLLFTDLEGFTTLTERLGAEEVARILNLHFTDATRVIKQHGGTVNRFMGDAVMAMWGAPLDDPRQARNAYQAACEMQADIAKLRERLLGQGLPPLRMRIGIHSCAAVVGNLGSADRFEYTAIGDGVNLAARLEGVNKLYHTGILLSGATAQQLGPEEKVRPVDRVIVKGKSEPVEIFTPCADERVIALTTEALAAYRARQWDSAEARFRELIAIDADDGVAQVYLERIGRTRLQPTDADWLAVVELEKL